MTPKGLLISFEGGEGGGKSLQAKLLADEYHKQGRKVLITREPGGTTISEQIREVVLSARNTSMAYTTEVLLYQAARSQIYRELIIPSLQAGKVVICDRTRDSSVVYQGMVRGFGVDLIEQLNAISTQETYPNVTFLLDLPVELGLARRATTDKMDRLDMERPEFHQKVRQSYLKLAKQNDRKRWIVIDANQSIKQVQQAILECLQSKKLL